MILWCWADAMYAKIAAVLKVNCIRLRPKLIQCRRKLADHRLGGFRPELEGDGVDDSHCQTITGRALTTGLSPCTVRAGHQGTQVFGRQERGRRRRSPIEQAPRTRMGFRGPQLVVDDAIHVGVVLAEVARRILE